jgi:hypothetical protein
MIGTKLQLLAAPAVMGLPKSSLLSGLVSYWKLDEYSDRSAAVTRYDSKGSNHLTEPSSLVSTVVGKRGNCLVLGTATRVLTCADNASISTGDIDFTFSAWLYVNEKTASAQIALSHWESSKRGYRIDWDPTTGKLRFIVGGGAGSSIGTVTNTNPNLNTWYHVIAEHDAANNKVRLYVDNGSAEEANTTGAAGDSDQIFVVGGEASLALATLWKGYVDEVGFWKRLLTADERAALYYGGAGNSYPFNGRNLGTYSGLLTYSSSVGT